MRRHDFDYFDFSITPRFAADASPYFFADDADALIFFFLLHLRCCRRFLIFIFRCFLFFFFRFAIIFC